MPDVKINISKDSMLGSLGAPKSSGPVNVAAMYKANQKQAATNSKTSMGSIISRVGNQDSGI